MSSPIIIINKFHGGQGAALEFSGWHEHLQMVALNTPTPNASGLNLLGTILTDAQWFAHGHVAANNIQVPFARVNRALADIPADPADTYFDRYKINDMQQIKWEKENSAILAFRTALLAALDEPSRRLLADPGGGTAVLNLTLVQIVERLAAQYGQIAPTQLSLIAHQLDDPFQPGTDMLAYLAHQTELQRILAQAGEQLQDGAKIRHAREAVLKGAGNAYEPAIAILEERCRTEMPPVRMTWALFCDAMVAASLRIGVHATMGTAGFGAGAVMGPTQAQQLEAQMYGHPPIPMLQTPTPMAPQTQGHVPDTVAAIVALVRAELGKGQAAHPPNAAEKLIRQYCWTHGMCAHNGVECKSPKHTLAQKKATSTNKMGGSTKGCGGEAKAT
ncbi:hypothetical protein B484DRAFT_402165 [Ochromonadaceae sp. CCMP2298]|nr:hypothetical protein B484DRAFT_402165 [Ochromonadaceae sp. CCMP2298]